jgi:hypothetical protein
MIPKSGNRFSEKDHAQQEASARSQISLRNLRKLDCFCGKPVTTFPDRAQEWIA